MKFLIVITLYAIGVMVDAMMRKPSDKEIEEIYQKLLRERDISDMPMLDNLYHFRHFACWFELFHSLAWPVWLIKDLITAMNPKET